MTLTLLLLLLVSKFKTKIKSEKGVIDSLTATQLYFLVGISGHDDTSTLMLTP